MKAAARNLLISIFMTFASYLPAFGQDFSDDPQGSIAQSVSLAKEALSNPLIFEGLSYVVLRYNRARVELSPNEYENEDWLESKFLAIARDVSSKSNSFSEVTPLPDEEVAEMVEAFSKNRDAFYSFYDDIPGEFGLQNISADQMLTHLAAYAVVTNTVDSGLWDALSSITGVWPFCVWQG